MSTADFEDRAAIFARRALLLSTALASLGCRTGAPDHAASPDGDVIDVPPAPPTTGEVPVPAPPPPNEPAYVPFAEPVPKINAPANATVLETKRLAELDAVVGKIYADLQAIEESFPPGCPDLADRCRRAWEALAKTRAEAEIALGRLSPLCGFHPLESPSLVAAHAAHASYAQRWITHIDQQADRLTRVAGAKVGQWNELADQQRNAIPVPCLSCMNPCSGIWQVVTFPTAAATLDEPNRDVVEDLARMFRQAPGVTFEVVGYGAAEDAADPTTRATLALKRAEAVRKALVAHGIEAARLSAVAGTEARNAVTFRPISGSICPP